MLKLKWSVSAFGECGLNSVIVLFVTSSVVGSSNAELSFSRSLPLKWHSYKKSNLRKMRNSNDRILSDIMCMWICNRSDDTHKKRNTNIEPFQRCHLQSKPGRQETLYHAIVMKWNNCEWVNEQTILFSLCFSIPSVSCDGKQTKWCVFVCAHISRIIWWFLYAFTYIFTLKSCYICEFSRC